MGKITLGNIIKRIWGDNCSAYDLLNEPNLSIIHEIMPTNTSEVKHYHKDRNQFFYCLEGVLTVEVDDKIHILGQYEGIYIKAQSPHVIKNQNNIPVEFLAISDNNSKDKIVL
ncbi:MAG: Mannose-6-phosphate isomerase [Burkholderiales bacterium]|nr:Mannose-6-phosphate isomerase [Burkholderiales bacterium]